MFDIFKGGALNHVEADDEQVCVWVGQPEGFFYGNLKFYHRLIHDKNELFCRNVFINHVSIKTIVCTEKTLDENIEKLTFFQTYVRKFSNTS